MATTGSHVASVDELEEQVASAGDDRQVSDLIDDEQARSAEEADTFLQSALPFGARLPLAGRIRTEAFSWTRDGKGGIA